MATPPDEVDTREATWLTIYGLAGGFLLASCLGLLILAFATSGLDQAAATGDRSDPAVLLTGERIYARECARCHGADGRGGSGLPLGGGIVVERYPDVQDQIAVITDGRRAMPGFGGELTPAEIDAVARYEREQLGS